MSNIIGYKAFNKDFTNRYGQKIELNKIYSYDGQIEFGKKGFHFCTYLEDTLRYFDGFQEIIICLVKSHGDILTYNDEYYGFYDMHVTNKIEIIKVLNRQEIIEYMLNANTDRINRFISLFRLNNKEIEMFKNCKSKDKIYKYIMYYQYGKEDAFK